MMLSNKIVLVTGANRGIGHALVQEALRGGAKRVYAGTRQSYTHSDARVKPVLLDVTNAADIQTAARTIPELDMLVNNAGIAEYDDLTERSVLERHLAVNLFGMWGVTQAFAPALRRSHGAVVNGLSIVALAALPLIPSYSISKAAAFSLTQSLRALFAKDGVSVHAALTGPVDTDMSRGLDIPKASPDSVARAIFAGVARGDDEIFPDPMSTSLADEWRDGAIKAMGRQNATLLTSVPA
jgi:NAD(P)-dependent dehydrogenase (short-subunit alcohol dehydrogenase family)